MKLVREAQSAFRSEEDRSYRIHIDLEPGAAELFPFLAMLAPVDSPLWARNGLLRIDVSQEGRAWSCGRDAQKRVWIKPEPGIGLIFDADEVPAPLAQALDLCSMDLKTLLGAMLTDFDVASLRDEGVPEGVRRVRGTLKPNRANSRMRSIVVDIEARTKLVQRVVVTRWHAGRSLAGVSFTFAQNGTQPEASYQLSSHLY